MEKNRIATNFLILGGFSTAAFLLYNKFKMTKNFNWSEVSRSGTADSLGINNEPNDEQKANAKRLAVKVLQPVRSYLNKPISVTSWFRSPELNQAIGGSASSHHMQGNAADLKINGNNGDIWKAILLSGVPFTELIIEFGTLDNPEWVHVAYNGRNERKILRAERNAFGGVRYATINENNLRLIV